MIKLDTHLVRLPLGSVVDAEIWSTIWQSCTRRVNTTDLTWSVDSATDPIFFPLRQVLHFL